MGFGATMATLLRTKRQAPVEEEPTLDERAEKGKAVAEEINKALPKGVSGREAVLKKRKQLADIDKMLEEK